MILHTLYGIDRVGINSEVHAWVYICAMIHYEHVYFVVFLKEEVDEPKVFEMPPSWVNQINISQQGKSFIALF